MRFWYEWASLSYANVVLVKARHSATKIESLKAIAIMCESLFWKFLIVPEVRISGASQVKYLCLYGGQDDSQHRLLRIASWRIVYS